MQNLGKIILFSIAVFQFAWSASVEATVSSSKVVQGNPVQLQITAIGDQAEFPDIQEIEDARILGQSRSDSVSITSVNGKSSRQNRTTLLLHFIPEQNMTIPSYAVVVDGTTHQTKPIKIAVVQSAAPKMQNNAKFSLQMLAEKSEVTVGESFVATVYFLFADGLRLVDNPRYEKPTFEGFFVKEVQEPKTYRKDNQNVQEIRYILTAKQEGNYTIGPAKVNIPEQDSNTKDPFGIFMNAEWTKVISNMIPIKVMPAPQSSDLIGSFTLKSSVDTHEAKANKPVNLTIKIEGEGGLETFEISPYDIDDVTVYSNDAKVQIDAAGNGIKSIYTKSFAFIGDHDFTIPSREFSMYNPKTKRLEKLQIPSYEIKVKSVKPPQSPKENTILDTGAEKENSSSDKTQIKYKDQNEFTISWWMLVASFVFGLTVMYMLLTGLQKWKYAAGKNRFKTSEALKILYPHISKSIEVEEMVRKLYAKKNGDKNIQIDKKVLKEIMEQFI